MLLFTVHKALFGHRRGHWYFFLKIKVDLYGVHTDGDRDG